MYRDIEIFDLEPSPSTDQDIKLKPYLEHCHSDNNSIWLGRSVSILVFKILNFSREQHIWLLLFSIRKDSCVILIAIRISRPTDFSSLPI